ncbi:MAG TPA: hypothetical protein ENK18_25775 [Deltaproteobacteria bacterium]|nr:hypothetical protein [Deltaproteobacteria bacterium]
MASTALACGSTPEPTRWDDAAGEIDEGKVDKPIGSIVAGSAFNALLPADGFKDHARVFTQEREGYAEADYKLDGETVVTVSISDTRNNPSARNKFSDAKEELGGYPLVERGSNSSMVLVNDRFQVRASSRSLGASERKEWLGAASLDQLAGLN